jgi:hypothetical protein
VRVRWLKVSLKFLGTPSQEKYNLKKFIILKKNPIFTNPTVMYSKIPGRTKIIKRGKKCVIKLRKTCKKCCETK